MSATGPTCWDSVRTGPVPRGAVQITENGWGFMVAAVLLELELGDQLVRGGHHPAARQGVLTADDQGPEVFDLGAGDLQMIQDDIAAYLQAAGLQGPADPLASTWFIIPPEGVGPAEFWGAVNGHPSVAGCGPYPSQSRRALTDALRSLYCAQ